MKSLFLCAVEDLCSCWLAAFVFMDAVHFVPDHVFHVPLAPWEAGSITPFIFRIKSRPLACPSEPTRSSVLWFLPSLCLRSYCFPSCYSPFTLACLLSWNMPNSFLPHCFFNTCCSSTGMFFPPFLPHSQMPHSFPSDLPLPKVFPDGSIHYPLTYPTQSLSIYSFGLIVFRALITACNYITCLFVYLFTVNSKRAETCSHLLLFLQEHRSCSYL